MTQKKKTDKPDTINYLIRDIERDLPKKTWQKFKTLVTEEGNSLRTDIVNYIRKRVANRHKKKVD